MMIVLRTFVLLLLLLWLPLSVAWVPLWAYTFYFGPFAPMVLAILLDWYYVATIPYLSLCALITIVTVPFVRSRVMFYTR